jgi:hypothetical protein
MEALGRTIDLSVGAVPVDLATAAVTGKRVALRNVQGLTVVLFKGLSAAGGELPVLTFNQHTASSGGSSQTIAGAIDHYYAKSAVALAGTEVWTRITQAAAAVVTLPAGEAVKQGIYVFEVDGTKLADGFKYVSVDVADVGASAQIGGLLYVLRDLEIQRTPQNLAAALS